MSQRLFVHCWQNISKLTKREIPSSHPLCPRSDTPSNLSRLSRFELFRIEAK